MNKSKLEVEIAAAVLFAFLLAALWLTTHAGTLEALAQWVRAR